ncbi:MAG TPA: hypothetical protein VI934_04460 [Candidatus Nanoarchaeia archaeon]|nr:hypothetical protein [Candidatus Nanoarchaeia archaeon]
MGADRSIFFKNSGSAETDAAKPPLRIGFADAKSPAFFPDLKSPKNPMNPSFCSGYEQEMPLKLPTFVAF